MRDLGKYHQESLTPLLNKLPIGLSPQKEIRLYSSPIINIARGEGGGEGILIITFSFLSPRIQVREVFNNHKQKCSDLTESGSEISYMYLFSSTSAHLSVFTFFPSEDYSQYINFKGKDTEAQRGDP